MCAAARKLAVGGSHCLRYKPLTRCYMLAGRALPLALRCAFVEPLSGCCSLTYGRQQQSCCRAHFAGLGLRAHHTRSWSRFVSWGLGTTFFLWRCVTFSSQSLDLCYYFVVL